MPKPKRQLSSRVCLKKLAPPLLVEFLHHLRISFARLIGLTKGEAVGVQVVHVSVASGWHDHK